MATCGSSAGAKPVIQEFTIGTPFSFLTWAVPVLARRSTPGTAAFMAVPDCTGPFIRDFRSTATSGDVAVENFSGFGSSMTRRSGAVTFLTMFGFMMTPSFAMAMAAMFICSGVTLLLYWPMAICASCAAVMSLVGNWLGVTDC